jgi:hypothetical protein
LKKEDEVKKTTDELILEYEAMKEDDLMDSPHQITKDREEDTFLASLSRFFKRVKQLFKINCFHTFRT